MRLCHNKYHQFSFTFGDKQWWLMLFIWLIFDFDLILKFCPNMDQNYLPTGILASQGKGEKDLKMQYLFETACADSFFILTLLPDISYMLRLWQLSGESCIIMTCPSTFQNLWCLFTKPPGSSIPGWNIWYIHLSLKMVE